VPLYEIAPDDSADRWLRRVAKGALEQLGFQQRATSSAAAEATAAAAETAAASAVRQIVAPIRTLGRAPAPRLRQ